MRIILLAAVVGAAAIGSAAVARPGGTGSGHSGSLQVGWSNGGGHHVGKGGRTRFGIGSIEVDRRNGRHRGRSGRSRGDDFNPYAGVSIAGPVEEVDPHGNGFFVSGGGQSRLRGGRPYYDYDRAYPYEWTSAARGRPEWDEGRGSAERPARCTMENGVRVCRGW